MNPNVEPLPSFTSLDELVDFFDTHDMGDYIESLPEVNFDVDLRRKTHLVAIDEETNTRLTEIAEQEQPPAESLVNSWLKKNSHATRNRLSDIRKRIVLSNEVMEIAKATLEVANPQDRCTISYE